MAKKIGLSLNFETNQFMKEISVLKSDPQFLIRILSSTKAWFVQSTKLVLAVTGRRGAEPAAEDLPCGRLGEEPTKNLARGALSVDALFEWP